jgi:hypothetical protein
MTTELLKRSRRSGVRLERLGDGEVRAHGPTREAAEAALELLREDVERWVQGVREDG